MQEVTLRRWDASEHLATEDDITDYFKAVCEENDLSAIAIAIGDIARARSMNQLARDAEMTREGLYEALSLARGPSLQTVAKMAKALGLRFPPSKEEVTLHGQLVTGPKIGDDSARMLDATPPAEKAITGKHARVMEETGFRNEMPDGVETVRKMKVDVDQTPKSPTGLPPGAASMSAKR